jgi:hypothetical protein
VPKSDRRSLPPLSRARVDRFGSSRVKTSLLSVPGAVGAEAAGFTPVGEVMGSVVHQVGWNGPSRWAADRIKVALHNRGCSWGRKPPVSSSDLAM